MLKKTSSKEQTLTPKRKSFVLEYLIDKNAKQAAIRAGYSKKRAEVTGSYLLTIGKVKEEIDRQIALQEKRTLITADEVIAELKRIAMVDVKDIFNESGSLKEITEIPEDARRAIAGIDVEQLFEGRGSDRENIGQTKKIRLSDKVRALELLAKHLKLLTEKHELSIDEPIRIEYVPAKTNRNNGSISQDTGE
jgi:phage terminase small subunit